MQQKECPPPPPHRVEQNSIHAVDSVKSCNQRVENASERSSISFLCSPSAALIYGLVVRKKEATTEEER
jgi:hypothetical protein